MDAMDWRTPGILDMPDKRERAWLAQMAAAAGPAQAARLVLRQAPAGPSPGPVRWAVEIGAADLSGAGDPLPIKEAIGPATALVDRIRPGWSWAWIHAAPGVAHGHVVAHRHADALLARLPGGRRRTGGAMGLLAAMAAPLPPGLHRLDGIGAEQSAHARLAALGRATSPRGRALLACRPGSALSRAVVRSQGAAALVALEDAQGTGSPLLLAALPR